MICDLRSGRSHDRKILCQEIESRIDAGARISWRAWLYNGFTASYVSLLSISNTIGYCYYIYKAGQRNSRPYLANNAILTVRQNTRF